MRAIDELKRLAEKIASGDMHPDEPLFILRAQDMSAPDQVAEWCRRGRHFGTPEEKLAEAMEIAEQMVAWPVKQVPGRPETRTGEPPEGVG